MEDIAYKTLNFILSACPLNINKLIITCTTQTKHHMYSLTFNTIILLLYRDYYIMQKWQTNNNGITENTEHGSSHDEAHHFS